MERLEEDELETLADNRSSDTTFGEAFKRALATEAEGYGIMDNLSEAMDLLFGEQETVLTKKMSQSSLLVQQEPRLLQFQVLQSIPYASIPTTKTDHSARGLKSSSAVDALQRVAELSEPPLF